MILTVPFGKAFPSAVVFEKICATDKSGKDGQTSNGKGHLVWGRETFAWVKSFCYEVHVKTCCKGHYFFSDEKQKALFARVDEKTRNK